ncbi:unnamed protein product [Schistosoma rodhaini]|uniref:Uncharacterized protein n=1 Tax=Schistosoma rodhaini TaxID=6188 RepID=A0AA85FFX6_9TREM|nr:unnamed protein product [Schistosoma rodhaini]
MLTYEEKCVSTDLKKNCISTKGVEDRRNKLMTVRLKNKLLSMSYLIYKVIYKIILKKCVIQLTKRVILLRFFLLL